MDYHPNKSKFRNWPDPKLKIYIINSLVCLFVTLSRLHFSTDSELKHMYGLLVAQGVPENYFPCDIPRNKKNLALTLFLNFS